MTFERMNSAGYLVNHLARLFADALRERIAPLGIVPGQFPALLALWEKDGLTQKELLKLLDIEQATLANTLTRMERDGLVVRREHPSDARARTIHLTAKANGIRVAAYAAARETNEKALDELSSNERQQFLDSMKKVISAMDKSS